MSSKLGTLIAGRSLSLAKTYVVQAIFMTVVGTLFSGASHIASIASTVGVPSTDVSFFTSTTSISFFAVPLQALAAMFFATPVVLLFVYDKNNGVLEYLLSLGISQRDIYMQYLKAGLILAGAIGVLDIFLDVTAGTLFSAGSVLFEIPILAIALDVSVVSLVTLIMMSFGSFQKQRVGSNQLLGTSVGAVLVMPTFYIPLLLPSITFWLDLGLACVIAGLSMVTFIASSRLIKREKLLP
ncbi:MAG TPA: hypothetical protein VLY21_05750 [Nitrososphaerales archaeon]|nr:hypothetical protein [Nitrososphaerales archaeon]